MKILAYLLYVFAIATVPISGYGAELENLQGTYKGNYTGSRSIDAFETIYVNGSTKAKFQSKSDGEINKIVIYDTKSDSPETVFKTQFDFQKGNKAKTTAIIPGGIASRPASGTWKVDKSGKKITFKFAVTTFDGIYRSKGTITGTGKNLKINITFTAEVLTFNGFLPQSGFYKFNGNR